MKYKYLKENILGSCAHMKNRTSKIQDYVRPCGLILIQRRVSSIPMTVMTLKESDWKKNGK